MRYAIFSIRSLIQRGEAAMFGQLGIAFFALLALWLLWKCIFRPLRVDCAKKDVAIILLILMLLVLLHLFGSGFIELMKLFGLEKFVNR